MIYRIFWALPTGIIFLFVYNCIVKLGTKMDRSIYIMQNVFIIYIAVLLTVTLDLDKIWVSIWYRYPLPKITLFSGNVNFSPFNDVKSWRGWVMLLENVLLFTPFGWLVHTVNKRLTCIGTVLAALLCSTIIEGVQFIIGRTLDIDDLAMNTFGAVIGWLLWKLFQRLLVGSK